MPLRLSEQESLKCHIGLFLSRNWTCGLRNPRSNYDKESHASSISHGTLAMSTILIVDDDATLRETLAYNLEQEGYKALMASDGEAALGIIRGTRPDLVLLDVMLPVIDGLSVCRMVRRDADIAETPIIILTARGAQGDKMVGLDSGADDYITKPFGVGELLARIRAVMRRTSTFHGVTSDLLGKGDIQVDLSSHKAYRGTELLNLSRREFDLLAELVRNQGTALSRDLLLSRVWGYDFYGDTRTVDVHIRWLREKIEVDPANPQHIHTVRGIGYRFEA